MRGEYVCRKLSERLRPKMSAGPFILGSGGVLSFPEPPSLQFRAQISSRSTHVDGVDSQAVSSECRTEPGLRHTRAIGSEQFGFRAAGCSGRRVSGFARAWSRPGGGNGAKRGRVEQSRAQRKCLARGGLPPERARPSAVPIFEFSTPVPLYGPSP